MFYDKRREKLDVVSRISTETTKEKMGIKKTAIWIIPTNSFGISMFKEGRIKDCQQKLYNVYHKKTANELHQTELGLNYKKLDERATNGENVNDKRS